MAEDVPFIISAVDRTKEAFESVGRNIEGVKDKILSWQGAVLTAVGVGGMGELVKTAFESGDALGKMSDRIGISTESLAAFQLMAQKADVSNDELTTSVEKMTKSIGDAERGTGKAAAVFKDLGLNVNQLAHMSADKQFEAISDKIALLGTQTEKASATTAIFGKTSFDMINIIQNGKNEMEEARKKTEEFGLSLSRVDAAKLELANDSLKDVKNAIMGVANSIALALAPYLKAVAEYFTDAAAKGHGFKEQAGAAVEFVAKAVGFLADMFHGLGIAFLGAETVIDSAAAVIVGIFNTIIQVVGGVELAIMTAINKAIEAINTFKGLHIPEFDTSGIRHSMDVIGSLADTTSKNVIKDMDDMKKKLDEPMPSDAINAYFQKTKAEAEKQAQAIAAAHNKMMHQVSEDTGDMITDADKKKIQKNLDDIDKMLRSSIQQEKFEFEKRKQDLEDALTAGMITTDQFNKKLEAMYAAHEKKLTELAKSGALDREKFMTLSYKDQTQMVLGQLQTMTDGVAQSNKTMFEMNKVASIANAIINTFQGFTMALATYPPPISWAMAAVTLAAGLAQVAAIQSTQFGGGTTPSAAASGPTYNGQPLYQQQTVTPGGQTVGNITGGNQNSQGGVNITIHDNKTIHVNGDSQSQTEAMVRRVAREETAHMANHINETLMRGAIPG